MGKKKDARANGHNDESVPATLEADQHDAQSEAKQQVREDAATNGIKTKKHKHDDAATNGADKPKKKKKDHAAEDAVDDTDNPDEKSLKKKVYVRELANLQLELAKLQEWIKHKGLRVIVLFEGRDAAGKGGTIKRVTQTLNPRVCKVVALGTPTEREKSQWYFQRYVAHLPAAGEMVLFDRSWYNRAGVERVMGFCSNEEYEEFMRSCPEFERMLVRAGIILIKYWFSVSDEEQERRFQSRIADPTRRWKLSPMDLFSRSRWVDYSRAKDAMFSYTDIKQAPWYVVHSDDKRRAHLNCINHLLSLIPYEAVPLPEIVLPPRQEDTGYVRPPEHDQTFVPAVY